MFYLKYALKSLIQRRRQYISLFTVCTISVCIIISLLSICDGMLKALNKKAVQYYGGELQFLCSNTWGIENPEEKESVILEILSEKNIKASCYARFDFDGDSSQFYFEGATAFCRVLKGIDFVKEKDLLKCVTFVEGDFSSIGEKSILISEPVSKKLGCHFGDSLTVMVKTASGYINTMDLVVSGIFQDSSLFGMYTSYLDISCLKLLTEYSDDFINRIGIYTPENKLTKKQILFLQKKLEQHYNMVPIPKNKEDYIRYSYQYSKPLNALITLDANRPEVVMMSNALRLIVYLIIIPLVLIVAIGISCSYRVVIFKRIVETSTFRALGLKARGVEKLFFTEVLMILLVGFIVGTGLSFAVTAIIGHFNFSFIPAFDLFLIGGRIKADYSFWKIIFVLFIIAFSTLTGVFVTLRNIIRLSPAKAFATTV